MKKYGFSLSITVLALAILACAEFTVNNSDESRTAIVHVTLPGGDGGTRSLAPGETFTWTASDDGKYTVKVLPSEDYLAVLGEMQDYYSNILLDPAAYNDPSEIVNAIQISGLLKTRIEDLKAGAICSGDIPYSSPEDDMVEVSLEISFDDLETIWTCN